MRFADLLIKKINDRKDNLLRVILEPERSDFYRTILLKHWFSLPLTKEGIEGKVYAVDSSDAVIELAGGGVIYIVRAAALSNRRDEVRKLDLDAFYPPSDEKLSEYRVLAREHSEHLAAMEAIQSLNPGDAILIDGSIFGRMTHVFRALEIPGKEDFMLTYVKTFYQFLSKCLERNVILLGVAKDSRSTLLRESLLVELLLEKMKNYDTVLQLRILSILRSLHRFPRQASKAIQEIAEAVGEDICMILRELLDNMPDYKMIMSSRIGSGFSHPLKLELRNIARGFVEILYTPERRWELARAFISSLPLSRVHSKLEKFTYNVLEYMASYPAVGAFYVKFAENDIPLRIDIVHPSIERWGLEKEGSISGYVRFASDWRDTVHNVLELLGSLYAGLKNYNVLLTIVDKYVKMTYATKNLYKRKIESLLDMLIQQSRGVRRVSFP